MKNITIFKEEQKMSRTWLITGVSSGFGNEMTKQLLEKGDTVIGTVRNTNMAALMWRT